ncbi:class I SAM-dependent methyltransferase [Actinotalea ferrariae]|uniref:SAM-dependent methyltransferase n=1 Tax=Actinotalea ferrariae TaxID=1386098 RepID=UPI001C8CAD18|nr:class I SAM-dependent methyltransferase [Actinotalea ferrariae]MBX9245341.1 class I SAM-dependent methyltransferase [Actinotalea ferrariae]
MTERVPHRITTAIARLDPPPDARVLEIGPGPGVSLGLLCDRVPDGHVVGVDRSATAVERALARNAEHVAAGRLTIRQGTLAELDGEDPFDRVLAVNVNVFWTAPATEEVRRIRELLAPDGRALLVFEPPDAASLDRVAAAVRGALEAGGLAASAERDDALLLVTAHHP